MGDRLLRCDAMHETSANFHPTWSPYSEGNGGVQYLVGRGEQIPRASLSRLLVSSIQTPSILEGHGYLDFLARTNESSVVLHRKELERGWQTKIKLRCRKVAENETCSAMGVSIGTRSRRKLQRRFPKKETGSKQWILPLLPWNEQTSFCAAAPVFFPLCASALPRTSLTQPKSGS